MGATGTPSVVFYTFSGTVTPSSIALTQPNGGGDFIASTTNPFPPPNGTTPAVPCTVGTTYNAYSIDGDVTGPLVYVNYGRPEDYDELEAAGVSVRGAVVIARYGGSFRGTKPKIAFEHGAIGCVRSTRAKSKRC